MSHTPAKPVLWDDARLADPHHQADKAARVRAMFDSIAPTYERANTILSAGCDASWRRRAVRMAQVQPSDVVLDIACGTGDFTRAFGEAHPAAVLGCDFSRGMLHHAADRSAPPIRLCGADALALPFRDAAFSVVSCAFGVRNFQYLDRGLSEMARVLRPAGRAVILEFAVPRSRVLGSLYRFYFHHILPRVGALVSGDRNSAYRYLPQSVSSFLDAGGMMAALRAAGLSRIECASLTFGVVNVFVAWKDA